MTFIKNLFIGKMAMQSFFERLHRISLRGMNYGLGGIIDTSGEKNLLKLVNFELKNIESPILFDVGANDGKYIEEMCSVFNRNTPVIYGFEPSKFTYEKLVKKFENDPNIHLKQIGLAANKGEMQLYYNEQGSGWASLYERQVSEFNKGLSQSEVVSLDTLDNFCLANDIDHVDFMKIDVEGHELEVLKGGKETLKNIRFIQFEFSFANYDSRTFMKDFFEILNDFKIYRILQNGIRELSYDPRYEIMMTTNFLAINQAFKG